MKKLLTFVFLAVLAITASAQSVNALEQLKADIIRANELLSSSDTKAQEDYFTIFMNNYETAVSNKEYYTTLAELMKQAWSALNLGESEQIDMLSDYVHDNEIEEKIEIYAFDNA